jgi:2,3-dihydroxybiphenyl 1,2-dioxygenase
MGPVIALGYLVVTTPELGVWRTLLCEVLGAEIDEEVDTWSVRLDERALRLVLQTPADDAPVPSPSPTVLGLEVQGPRELAAVADHLAAVGAPVGHDPGLALQRRVQEVVVSRDPSGQPLELFWGAAVRGPDSVAPEGFLTGDLGLGHVVIAVDDVDEAMAFYRPLGFTVSDRIESGPIRLEFLRCNARHHSLALARVPGALNGVQHLMVELTGVDDVGLRLDRAHIAGVPITKQLGRHANDRVVSFYVPTPAGFELEIGSGGLRVDEATWQVTEFRSASVWGHRRPVTSAQGSPPTRSHSHT